MSTGRKVRRLLFVARSDPLQGGIEILLPVAEKLRVMFNHLKNLKKRRVAWQL